MKYLILISIIMFNNENKTVLKVELKIEILKS